RGRARTAAALLLDEHARVARHRGAGVGLPRRLPRRARAAHGAVQGSGDVSVGRRSPEARRSACDRHGDIRARCAVQPAAEPAGVGAAARRAVGCADGIAAGARGCGAAVLAAGCWLLATGCWLAAGCLRVISDVTETAD